MALLLASCCLANLNCDGNQKVSDQPVTKPVAQATRPSTRRTNLSAELALCRKRLQQRLPAFAITDAPLTDVITLIRELTNASIHLDWQALNDAGVDFNATVTVDAKDMTIEDFINTVLDRVKATKPLGFGFLDGRIEISTKEALIKMAAEEGAACLCW